MAFDPGMIGQGLGLGFELAGAFTQYQSAKKQSEISQKEFGVEQQQDAVRRQAMELQYNRQSKQNLRQAQSARSIALATGTAQGASQPQSSGLQGGLAGISGQANVNQLGLSQNLQLGEKMFDLNAQLNLLKQQMAGEQSNQAFGQGLSGIGGGFMSFGSAWSKNENYYNNQQTQSG